MTRNTDRKVPKLPFRKFSEEEKQQVEYEEGRFASQGSFDKCPSFRVQTIVLHPLQDEDAFNLLLAKCNWILTPDDLGSSDP